MASGLTTRITEGRLQHRCKHLKSIFCKVFDCWTSKHPVSDNFRGPSGEARSEFEIQVGQVPSTHWLETNLDCDTRLKSKLLRQSCHVRCSFIHLHYFVSKEVIWKREFYCTTKSNSTTDLRVELYCFHRRTQYAKSKFTTNFLWVGYNMFIFSNKTLENWTLEEKHISSPIPHRPRGSQKKPQGREWEFPQRQQPLWTEGKEEAPPFISM